MLTQDWIDPRAIDWTDARNPLAKPGWNQNNNPFAWACMNDVFNQALRLGRGLEPRIYVCPEPVSQLITPLQQLDYEVPSEPNLWLWGINASVKASGEGGTGELLINIVDALTGSQMWSQPISTDLLKAPAPIAGAGRGPIIPLPTPHCYSAPSYPVVRIVNPSDSITEFVRVNLFGTIEYVPLMQQSGGNRP